MNEPENLIGWETDDPRASRDVHLFHLVSPLPLTGSSDTFNHRVGSILKSRGQRVGRLYREGVKKVPTRQVINHIVEST